MRRPRSLAVLAMTGLLIASLGAVAQAQSPSATPSGLAGTDWLLASVAGAPVASGTNATLRFSEADAGGFGGCNQFFASYQSDGPSSLTFGPVASTLIACDAATDALEQAYFTALGAVASYTVSDAGLSLADGAGTEVLTFGGTPPASVEGPWTVTMVNNGTGGVETVPVDVSASVSFHPDLTVEGFGGCNQFSGAYAVDGDAISIGPLLSTMMSCGEAADTFEARLLTALQASTTWSVTGATLDLRDDDGAQQVEATSAVGH